MEVKFNERAFLVRALMGIFILQFATIGFQTYSCQSAIRNIKESDKVSTICESASESFNETGKLALATFLALLVPAAAVPPGSSSRTTRKKPSSDEETLQG